MALTLVDGPGLISFSKNPIEFHLRSDSYVTQQPTTPVYDLTFTTKLSTIGSYLKLEWDGNSVEFFVQGGVTVPTGSNLPDDITSTTLGQYVTALADDWFPANYLLERDFIIEDATSSIIRFTAKRPGTELTITHTTTIPAGQAVWSTNTAPIAWNLKSDFTVVMDIEVEETYDSNEWTRVGSFHGDPVLYDDSGTWKGDCKIDVHTILDGFLQNRIDPPVLATATPYIANNTNLRWRAIYCERYTSGGTVVHNARIITSKLIILKGGLDYLDVPALADLQTDFYGTTVRPFNTWQPTVKEVTVEEPHWLYYLTHYNLTGTDRFGMTAKVYYTDGTTDQSSLMTTDVQEQWETYIYRVGFNDEGLDLLQPTKTPYKYEVWLTDTAVSFSTKVMTFMLVGSTRQDRFFLFENSTQGWSTLRTSGTHTAINKVSKTEAKKPVQAGYAADEANVLQKSNGFTNSYEVFIGPKPKEEFIYLRDFMNAERHFEVIDGKLIPIVVDTVKMKLEYEETGSYDFVQKFTYRQAFMNKGYSNN